jgi:hypothetical protein
MRNIVVASHEHRRRRRPRVAERSPPRRRPHRVPALARRGRVPFYSVVATRRRRVLPARRSRTNFFLQKVITQSALQKFRLHKKNNHSCACVVREREREGGVGGSESEGRSLTGIRRYLSLMRVRVRSSFHAREGGARVCVGLTCLRIWQNNLRRCAGDRLIFLTRRSDDKWAFDLRGVYIVSTCRSTRKSSCLIAHSIEILQKDWEISPKSRLQKAGLLQKVGPQSYVLARTGRDCRSEAVSRKVFPLHVVTFVSRHVMYLAL